MKVTAEMMGAIIPYLAPAVSIDEVREKLSVALAHAEIPSAGLCLDLIETLRLIVEGFDPEQDDYSPFADKARIALEAIAKAEGRA